MNNTWACRLRSVLPTRPANVAGILFGLILGLLCPLSPACADAPLDDFVCVDRDILASRQ
jgi:hypothetical protein